MNRLPIRPEPYFPPTGNIAVDFGFQWAMEAAEKNQLIRLLESREYDEEFESDYDPKWFYENVVTDRPLKSTPEAIQAFWSKYTSGLPFDEVDTCFVRDFGDGALDFWNNYGDLLGWWSPVEDDETAND